MYSPSARRGAPLASRYDLTKPIKVGSLTIWPVDPPEGFEPKAGERHFRLDTSDPLFTRAVAYAEAEGFTDTEFANALSMYAGAAEKAEADGKSGDLGMVHHRLGTLMGEGDAAMALANAATPEQLAALELMSGQLVEQRRAAAGTETTKAPTMTREELRQIQASPEYLAERSENDPLHKKVRDGYVALYPPGSGPTDRVLNRGQAPGGSARGPETDPARIAEVQRLRAIMDTADYSASSRKQAEVREGYQKLYPGTSNIADHNRGSSGDSGGEQ